MRFQKSHFGPACAKLEIITEPQMNRNGPWELLGYVVYMAAKCFQAHKWLNAHRIWNQT